MAIVFYEKDVDLAGLLARTLGLFLPSSMVKNIFFLDNHSNPSLGRAAFDQHIKPNFQGSSLVSCVEYVAASELGVDPVSNSYSAQQALKLEIAKLVDTPYYLSLDTKNHLTRPVTWSDFFSDDGRAKSHKAVHGGYLQTCLKHSMAYFKQEVLESDDLFLPTVTPYMLHRETVLSLLREIAQKDEATVQHVINENDKRTEFLLYCAFLKYKGIIEHLYELCGRPFVTLFARWPQEPDVIDRLLKQLEHPQVFAFGVHSKRFVQLSDKHAKAIGEFWFRRGVFESVEGGLNFIRNLAQLDSAKPVSHGGNLDGKVKVGRNKRLFLHNDTNGLLNQHLGRDLLTENDCLAWQRTLDLRREQAERIGAEYHFLVAPDTASIYPEDHPDLDGYDGLRPILQLRQSLHPSTPWTYPLEELRAARLSGEVCHPSDSHWTGFGAYVAYNCLAHKLNALRELGVSEVDVFNKRSSGDLGDKLNPPLVSTYTECVLKAPMSHKVWNNGINNRGYMGYWRSAQTNLPRAILFMDSYGWKFERFFSASFSEVFTVHTPYFEAEAVEMFRPHVIVNLMAERFVIKVPKDGIDKSALESAKEKQAGASYPSLNWLRGQ